MHHLLTATRRIGCRLLLLMPLMPELERTFKVFPDTATPTMAPETVEMPVLRIITPSDVEVEDLVPVDATAREQALQMMSDVKEDGENGLLKHAWRFGEIVEGSRKYLLSRDELEAAFKSLPEDQQGLLERTAARIRHFAEIQLASVSSFEVAIAGGRAGQIIEPLQRAGCYAPGGRYPLPSSVLMTAVTARVAGVKEVVVASPRPTAVTKGAAFVAGADCLLAIGGAHGIAALAYGVGLAACDIIVGPGNKWVTAAKAIVSGTKCSIDMLAGPSEVLVIADASANPAVVAADLLAQAEHDVAARPMLVTPDASVIARVNEELQNQLAILPTRDVAIPAVRKGFAVLTTDMDAAVAVTNRLGPEHLEVHTEEYQKVANSLTSYGGLFIGYGAAEALGDYGAGPNHVLPTSCTAKYTGGLSVHTFLRKSSWMKVEDAQKAQEESADSVLLAQMDGLKRRPRSAHFLPTLIGDAVKKPRTG